MVIVINSQNKKMEALKQKTNRIFSVKIARNIILLLLFSFVFDFLLFPIPTLANEAIAKDFQNRNFVSKKSLKQNKKQSNFLPLNPKLKIKKISYHTITAYNSEESQCDASPCITANGFNLCKHKKEDTVALNFLKLGDKIRIPELFGDRVFIVRDRMNKRYPNRIDVWTKYKENAKDFGIKHNIKIEILE